MRKILFVIAIVGVLLISLFSQTRRPENFKVVNDLLYVENATPENDLLQRLNLVIPKETKAKPPLLVWIGGGAWSYVDRKMEMDLAKHFAREGIAVASIGHRLSAAKWKDPKLNTGIQHPKHIEDVATAFRWLYDNSAKYGYDRDKMFVGGFSSGAHLATLLALDYKYLKKHGLSRENIKGVIPIGGAYDIENYHQAFLNGRRKELATLHVEAVFGKPEGFREASPTSFVKNLTMPMLLVSETDTYNYATIFEDKVRESGFRNFEVLHINNIGHGSLWRNLSYTKDSPYRSFIIGFLKKHSA